MIRAFLSGDAPTAAAIHYALTPLVDALFATTSPIPLKYALGKVGFDVGQPRLPLVPIDPKSQAVMDAALAKTTIDLSTAVPV
jgi:4-hydroxy-tetrahydrodipicolinate synthase